MNKCGDCSYWDKDIAPKELMARYGAMESKINLHTELESREFGICKRYPPTVLVGLCPSCKKAHVISRFPLVYLDTTCGEFKPLTED